MTLSFLFRLSWAGGLHAFADGCISLPLPKLFWRSVLGMDLHLRC